MNESSSSLIVRQAVKVQVPMDYVQVTADSQREVALWCDGVVTDDLEFSPPVGGYIRPNTDDAWYLTVLVAGVVVNTVNGPLVARISDYVLRVENGVYEVVNAEDFARDYRDVFMLKRRETGD